MFVRNACLSSKRRDVSPPRKFINTSKRIFLVGLKTVISFDLWQEEVEETSCSQ